MTPYAPKRSKNLHEIRLEEHKLGCIYYQFQPASLTRLTKISRNKLWMSDPSKFNDPLDLRLQLKDLSYRGPFDDEFRLRKAMRVLIEDNPDVARHWFYNSKLLNELTLWIEGTHQTSELIVQIKLRMNEFGIACFTPIWNNTLMWSHYAESHTGYCIEYTVDEMTLNLPGTTASYNVQYVSKLPELCLSEALFSPHQTLGRMLATKHIEWAYEKEWRIAHLEGNSMMIDMPPGIKISALIAGQRSSQKLITHLTKKAALLKVPAYKVSKEYNYDLRLELL